MIAFSKLGFFFLKMSTLIIRDFFLKEFSYVNIEYTDYIYNSQNYLQYFYCQMDYWSLAKGPL